MYSRDLFRLIFSYTLNISDAKDILQDTFMKYYEKMFMISKDDLEIKKWLISCLLYTSDAADDSWLV